VNADVLPVQVQIRYERFPASLKGAFVVRGADGNPHAVQIESARVARIPAGVGDPFSVESRIVDVAPNRDLFLPFEAPVAEVESGWYVIEATVRVDGGRSFAFASRPFVIPWPRNDVRRGTIPVEQTVKVGRTQVMIDRVEMAGDTSSVVWWPEGEEPEAGGSAASGPEGVAILIADGDPLDILPAEAGRQGRGADVRARAERRTISYPVPRSTRSLAVAVRLRPGGVSQPVPLSFI
jgi:hypothetical protein